MLHKVHSIAQSEKLLEQLDTDWQTRIKDGALSVPLELLQGALMRFLDNTGTCLLGCRARPIIDAPRWGMRAKRSKTALSWESKRFLRNSSVRAMLRVGLQINLPCNSVRHVSPIHQNGHRQYRKAIEVCRDIA